MKNVYQNFLFLIASILTLSASAQTPVFNSYPSSPIVVFLDFDGHIVEGTSWNSGGPIVCQGSGLNSTQITTIFDRVAEDYRPFTLNITTDSTKYFSAPANKRMRVVLTTSSSWYGSAGGVAYINSFTWGDNTPCFVFSALLSYNTKNIAEATSHEIGHTLGLRHQASYDVVCNKTTEYNSGTGSGEIGWAPIMGVGYYRNMTLWNYGADPFGCTNYQDDLSIITGNGNGISFRPDDHANTTIAATTASFTNNNFTVNGVVERPADIDAVKFVLSKNGRFTLNAFPYSVGTGNTGSNIDLEMDLLNNAQEIIRVYNPATSLSVSIDTLLAAGAYYLRVRGRGNIYAPNYASLGSYTMNATFSPETALPLHKLLLKGKTENKEHKFDWEIIADEKVVSQTIEVATNGTNFQPLSTLSAGERKYSYLPNTSNLVYYRLNVVFDNGRQFYSNVVALRSNGTNSKPYMIGNVITGNITVSSPSACTYSIHDLSGRVMSKGALGQGVNTINANIAARGLYIIQYNNGSDLHTEKFIKE